jgi:hypothetical protein
VDGSELVFILMPIVIPLFLAIGIAAPYIADSRVRTSAGASMLEAACLPSGHVAADAVAPL